MKVVDQSDLEPRHVKEARVLRREGREQLGLAGGAVLMAGLVASAVGMTAAVPLAGIIIAGLGVAYAFPVTRRSKLAQAVLAEWDSRHLAAPPAGDARRECAEGMALRIQEYVGSQAPSAAAAWAMVGLIDDSVEDLSAVALLRAAPGPDPSRRSLYEQKAKSLSARIEARIDHAVAVIAEIYEAVLSEDDIALREVVAKAEAEVRRIEAEGEVSNLLSPHPDRNGS